MARHKKNLKQPILLPKNIRKKENKAQSQPEKENSKGYRGSKWNSFPLKNDIKWNQDGFFWKKKNRTDRLLNRLKTKQRVITNDGKYIIDEICIIWKYEDGKWQIKEAVGLKLGNLLY